MKTTLLAALLLLSLNCQAYRSIFGQQSTEWYIWYSTCFFTQGKDTFYVEKDTLVNGLNYKKISSYKFYHVRALMREDTIAGKVWYKSISGPSDTNELLAFDFSLKQGDIFNMKGNLYPDAADSLKTVDTIFYINGLKHIQFKASKYRPDTPYYMIEGLGGTYSVFWKESDFCYTYGPVCAIKDGERIYGSCETVSINPLQKNNAALMFYPQPADNTLHLMVSEQITKIDFYDLTGKRLLSYQEPKAIIDVSGLPEGIYIALIRTATGDTYRQRISIQR